MKHWLTKIGHILSFYLAVPGIYLVAILPFPLLYHLSDGLYLLMYHIIGYRRKVVFENLHRSFPEKTETEIKAIADEFYKHFCDITLESIKALVMSKKTLKKRVTFSGQPVLEALYQAKKSVVIVMGHMGNWEWGGIRFGLAQGRIHELYAIYHPLKHPYFDQLVYHLRTRFKSKLIPMNNVLRQVIRNKDKITATTFITDQAPSYEHTFWTTFLNQDTPVFLGAEKIAKSLDYPIVYIGIKKLGRGFYDIHAELLVENPKDFLPNQITALHTQRLEQDINAQPAYWLWSHRRWKRQKPNELHLSTD